MEALTATINHRRPFCFYLTCTHTGFFNRLQGYGDTCNEARSK